MRILVIRHAIAMDRIVFAKVGLGDEQRPLTDDGVRKMRLNAVGLARLLQGEGTPNVLFTSPLVRAKQTADILVRELWPDSQAEERDELIPSCSVDDSVGLIRAFEGRKGRKRSQNLFMAIVGHEPHLSSVVSYLLTGSQTPILSLRKGGACFVTLPDESSAGKACLEWHLRPRHLRKFCSR